MSVNVEMTGEIIATTVNAPPSRSGLGIYIYYYDNGRVGHMCRKALGTLATLASTSNRQAA